jgi:ADP-ribose pyrophosphatase YjhB (NUDIX family)
MSICPIIGPDKNSSLPLTSTYGCSPIAHSTELQVYHCEKGCCNIYIKNYTPTPTKFRGNKKAGVFIYDPKEERVLLVQSRGNLFGVPKGTLEDNEQERHCAIREVREETGLTISPSNFTRVLKLWNKSTYYYMEMSVCDVNIQKTDKSNDANGITWIKVGCLEQAIENGNIVLNHYAKIIFDRFLHKTFPKAHFTLVVSKKHRKQRASVETRGAACCAEASASHD